MHNDKEYKVLEQAGYDITKEGFYILKEKHPYIAEKLILDLVNGVGVVAKDLNDSAKGKEKGFARIWDSISGDDKKRQKQINENIIYGFEAASVWLQDHDRHLSRIDMRIKDVAVELYNTQDQILKFYSQFEDVEFRVGLLEEFKANAEARFEGIEQRIQKLEAKSQIDIEIAKIGKLGLPQVIEIFTVLDNLVSGEFGLWLMFEKDSKKKNGLITYIKHSLENKLDKNALDEFIDFHKVASELQNLEQIERKAIGFIAAQYTQFSQSSIEYEMLDFVKILSTVEKDKVVDEIAKYSHIRTFMRTRDFIDEVTNEFKETVIDMKEMDKAHVFNSYVVQDKNEKIVKKNNDIKRNVLKKEFKKTKLGVVLSGGGAKGAYEAGFLKALAEFYIQPDVLSGTSIGALNGSVYASQIGTHKVANLLDKIWKDLAQSKALKVDKKKVFLNIIEVISFFTPLAPISKAARFVKTASMLNSKEGVLTTEPVENILEKYAPSEKLLKGLPFYVGVTKSDGNIIDTLRLLGLSNSGLTSFINVQSLNKEDMHKIILASAALPIGFDAVKVNGTHYRDGCLGSLHNEWGNTPAKPLITEEKCTHLIVCHLNEGSYFNRHDPIFKDVAIIEIRPKSGSFSSGLDPLMFNVDKIDEWMKQGYEDSKRILEDSFSALQGKHERIASEQKSEDAVQILKNRKFSIPDR